MKYAHVLDDEVVAGIEAADRAAAEARTGADASVVPKVPQKVPRRDRKTVVSH
jgi:hypothetical protein